MSMETILLLALFAGVMAGILSGARIILVLMVVPFVVALLGTGFGAFDPALFHAIPQRIFGIMENQVLYAIPLFILMGKLLEHSRLAERMLLYMAGLSTNEGRSLGLAVLLTSVIIAAATGVIGATITMLAAIALPALARAGVHEKISAGLICAAGSLGQLVPPSIVLILLSDQISNAWVLSQRKAGNFAPEPISIAHLFSAAVLPAIILAVLYAFYLLFVTRVESHAGKKSDLQNDLAQPLSMKKREGTLFQSLMVVLVLVMVPLSVIFGFATAAEAASIGAIGVCLLTLADFESQIYKKALVQTLELTGVIFGIIISASVLALVFRGLGGDESVASALSVIPGEAMGALLVVMLVIFLLGFVIEFIEITYIIIPITAPVLFSMGVDPVWFAILVAVNLQISFLTPPLGIALFYYQSVSKIRAAMLYKAVVPFIGLQIFALLIVFLFPATATWLPSILI